MSGLQAPYGVPNGLGHAVSHYPTNEGTSTNSASALSDQDGVGSDGGYGVAGPSNGLNGYSRVQYMPSHNERIVEHIYKVGFQMAEYTDTLLHAGNHMYRLHALILSRSPYLAHLMSTSPKSGGMHTIVVPLEAIPEINEEGFNLALCYLYSSVPLSSVTPGNARAVLAAGCLLGGMDDLCSYAYQACKNSITVETINEWIDFINSLPSSSDGSASPSELPRTSIYGPFEERLRNDIFQFLVVTLPTILGVSKTSPPTPSQTPPIAGQAHGQGRETLLQTFSRVPFDLFKSAIESPTFQIGSDQERFRFAKAAIDLRKRARGNGAIETVVLAFGGGNSGSAVHVTRKMKKRALFKVG